MKIPMIIFLAVTAAVTMSYPATAGGKTNLVISYSAGNHGETDPCG